MRMRTAVIVLALALPLQSEASNKNIGTSAAPFLKMGAGARATAMGEAFVGLADDVNSTYFNPAGLSFTDRPALTAMHTQWIQDMNYEFAAFSCPLEKWGFGISAMTLKLDGLPKRGLDEANQGTFGELDAAYGLSFSRRLGSRLSVGLTTRYVKQQIDSNATSTWSGDVGVLKKLERLPMSFGLAMRHLGPRIKFEDESDPQPLTLDAGASVALLNHRLKMALDLKSPRDNNLQFGVGCEWQQKVWRDLQGALRGGYNSSWTDADKTTGLSVGGGFAFNQFGLDFAWVPFGVLGNTFRYAVLFRF